MTSTRLFVLVFFPAWLIYAGTVTAGETVPAGSKFQAPDQPTGTVDETLSAKEPVSSADQAMQQLYSAKTKPEYDAALKKVETLADQGDAEAAFRLGRFLHVESPAPNYEKAIALYQIAANKGHGRATNAIGMLYADGLGVKADGPRALQYFEKAAQLGEPRAFTTLARHYFLGLGVAKNPSMAVKWLEQGMAKNLAYVYANAADIYYFGQYDVAKDYPKALRYFEQAAQLGDLQAGWSAARMYLYGEGIPQDTQTGIARMEALAARNHPPAFTSLGFVYSSGKGVPVDHAKSFEYYSKGAELGDCNSMRNISASYQTGEGTQVDDVKAAQFLQMAVECGNPPDGEDVMKLGTFYRAGRGVEPDCDRAVQLFQVATQLGEYPALVDLGHLYEKGCGSIAADPNKGFRYYLMAAKSGVARGQNNVGAMLKHGVNGGQPERAKAYAWLTLAVQNGDQVAKTNLDDFAAMFSDADRKQAEEHLEVIKRMLVKPGQSPLEVWQNESY